MTRTAAIKQCEKHLERLGKDPHEGKIIQTGTAKNDKAEWDIEFIFQSGKWGVVKAEKIS